MTWKVHWLHPAENQLAALWVYAPDRKAITESADQIDQLLASEPLDCGVVYRNWRILFQGVLTVNYIVVPDQLLVEVLEVKRVSQ